MADLSTTPAMPAPSGEVSNFNPGVTEIQMKFITIYAGTLAGASICLALRIWTRAKIIRGVWADDYALIGAWLCDIGFFVSCVLWMKDGFGDHLWNVSLAQLVHYAENSISVVTFYCWAPMLTKFSILLLYLRLNPQKLFRIAVCSLMFIIFAYTIATTVIVAAGCKLTDQTKTKCINNLALAQSVLNIASDFFVIVLPLQMCYALQIPKGQKIALTIILAVGSFVVVTSIVRLIIIERLPGELDTTWVQAETCVWSAIEINVGIMCNCLIVLKPFVKEYGGKLLGSFFISSNAGPSAPRMSGSKILSKNEWKNNSFPLGSIDKERQTNPHHAGPEITARASQSAVGMKDDIVVTSSFVVEQVESVEKSKYGREFDTESQEDIIKRVKMYSK